MTKKWGVGTKVKNDKMNDIFFLNQWGYILIRNRTAIKFCDNS